DIDRPAVLEHHVQPAAEAPRPCLLERRPERGVVHVAESILVGAAERPRLAAGRARRTEREAGRGPPPLGRGAVDLEKPRVEALRVECVIEVDPDALGLDVTAVVAADREAPGSGRPRDPTAPSRELDRVLRPKRLVHGQLRAADHPDVRVVVEAGVEPVVGRNVLQIAGDGVETQTPVGIRVGKADASSRREATARHERRCSATAFATAACPSASRCSTSPFTTGYVAIPSRSTSAQSSSSANDGPSACPSNGGGTTTSGSASHRRTISTIRATQRATRSSSM